MQVKELRVEEIDYSIDMSNINLDDIAAETSEAIGQDRAVLALNMGLEMKAKGYNIFVTGAKGTGRHTVIKKVLERYKVKDKPLTDIAFVYNYHQEDRPFSLQFAEGEAIKFREAMKAFINDVKELVKRELNSENFKHERDGLLKNLEQKERLSLSNFEKKIESKGFTIVGPEGDDEQSTDLQPLFEGEVVTFDLLRQMIDKGRLTEEQWLELRQQYYSYMDEMKAIFADLRIEGRNLENHLAELGRQSVKNYLIELIAQLKKSFVGADVALYLEHTTNDILMLLPLFSEEEEADEDAEESPYSLDRYGVNVIIDHSSSQERPMIIENNPTWANLFGAIEGKGDDCDFMDLRAGSLVKAHGGFLVLRLEELLTEDDVWLHLKRALLSGQAIIQSQPSPLTAPMSLKGEAISIDTKVILTGSEQLYDQLYLQDGEFQKLFKVVAEFDSTMVKTPKTTMQYSQFCKALVAKESLLTLEKSGLTAILAYAVKLSEHQQRLTAQLSLVSDIIRESSYWADKMGGNIINSEAVNKALQMRHYFNSLLQETIHREIIEKILMINIKGKSVGKINALVVLDRGNDSFGFPALITAQAAAGKDGLINIEKEVGLSGELHDKGVMILDGFLRSRFGRQTPLSITMSLCFEQSYDGVEGDSATLAETCVLLSSIAQVSLRQDIAVTGSMNQFGEVQPVGGVSDKVEGFFKICQIEGLTGMQGVIIPHRNICNLFLSSDTLLAIAEGNFHLWPVHSVEEALFLLTDYTIATVNKKGQYQKGTFFAKVELELMKMGN